MIGDFSYAASRAVRKNIEDAEMQHDILVGEAFGLPCVVQRVEGHAAVVHGDEDILSLTGMAESHVAAQPAFDPATLIVIAARALLRIIFAAFEAVDIEFPHIITDLLEVFDQFTVGHVFTS